MKIAVTGSNGFVGIPLCQKLVAAGHDVVGISRTENGARYTSDLVPSVQPFAVGDLGGSPQWGASLSACDAVIHLAGRAHVMKETEKNPNRAFQSANVLGTKNLLAAAEQAGVKRLVFVSTVKVNGDRTPLAKPFSETDTPNPKGPYAVSKWDAEQVVSRKKADTGLETVIVRPPLVYGPKVKGNLERLMDWISQGVPLPFASLTNRRSLVGVRNLSDFLTLAATHPDADGQTYLISDGVDLSTEELCTLIGTGLGRPARLFKTPETLRRLALKFPPTLSVADRIFGSLMVDCNKAKSEIGWAPPTTVREGILEMARSFRGRL